MIKEWKDRWVAWLRKPVNQQIDGALHQDGKYCCLGGLCELSGQGEWRPVVEGVMSYQRTDDDYPERDLVPKFVAVHVGLPFINLNDYYDGNRYTTDVRVEIAKITDDDLRDRAAGFRHYIDRDRVSLADLNDGGFTFPEIADIIEQAMPEEP